MRGNVVHFEIEEEVGRIKMNKKNLGYYTEERVRRRFFMLLATCTILLVAGIVYASVVGG